MVSYRDLSSRPLAADDPEAPLAYPFDLIQGPIGSVPISASWRCAFYWSTSLISGFVTFDVRPEDPGLMAYTTACIYVALIFSMALSAALDTAAHRCTFRGQTKRLRSQPGPAANRSTARAG